MFSLQNYTRLFSSLKGRGYNICPLSEINVKTKKPTILLRFDIDFCPQMAVEIAEINRMLKISGTFFFQMDSPLYNLWGSKSQEAVKKIDALKQEIGWHQTLIREVLNKPALLKRWSVFKKAVPEAIPLIAWHNPQDNLLKRANAVVHSSGVWKSVYAPPFISEQVKYISDSNQRNGFNDLMVKLQINQYPCAQLLLHPLNWVIGGNNMKQILKGTWNKLIKNMDDAFAMNSNWRG